MQPPPSPAELRSFVEAVAHRAYWERVTEWGYTLYFAAFALGALLLLVFCLLPEYRGPSGPWPADQRSWLARAGRWRWHLAHAGLVLLLLLCCVSQQANVDQRRGFIVDEQKRYRYERAISKLASGKDQKEVLRAEYLYLPEGDSLAYLTLGNTSLAADYLWLTGQQYVSSSFRRGHKFRLLQRIYENMLELDPHWVEAAINGGKVLSALEPDRYAVERFYINAILKNPDNWRLPYEAGRLFLVPPLNQSLRHDYSRRAVEWFKEVVSRLRKMPPSPAVNKEISDLEDMAGRLALESGPVYYEIGEELLWKRAHDASNQEAARAAAARDWLFARSLVIAEVLQQAVAEHRARTGAFPAALDSAVLALTKRSVIVSRGQPDSPGAPMRLAPVPPVLDGRRTLIVGEDGWPLEAYGFRVQYNAATGTVASKGVNARRTIQAASIVNGLLDVYRGNRGGENPGDLEQLQQFVNELYRPPRPPPPPAVLDALGPDLDVLVNPLGAPWDYDPKTGALTLPAFCSPRVLFRNAERILKQE